MINIFNRKKKKELERLRKQMLSDKGDELAMLKATNSELRKVLCNIGDNADLNLKEIRKALNV
jgi:hypothetical protein